MNDEQTAVFLRELLQETEIIVGSIRASAYQAILTITLADPQEWRETGSSLVTATLKDIDDACSFLDRSFVDRLKRSDFRLPNELWDLSRRTSRELTEFASFLRTTIADVKPAIPSKDSLIAIENHFTEKTRTTISEFLESFGELVTTKATKSRKMERNLITSAIAQIDHISTSINMISVNASVEAARAGEFGKSFAVIAAEIQSLSSQSKQAIQKIRNDL